MLSANKRSWAWTQQRDMSSLTNRHPQGWLQILEPLPPFNSLRMYNYKGKVSPEDTYVERKLVSGGNGTVWDNVQTQVKFNNIARSSVYFDDFSIVEYHPPAKLVSPTPDDKWCDLAGSPYTLDNKDKVLAYDVGISLQHCGLCRRASDKCER